MAARLSYLLWNTTPDAELIEAVERGELIDDEGLARQVDRMLASPRIEESVRAFFSDLFGFDEIEAGLVRKDPALFPAFNQALMSDAREQTLRVIADHLLGEGVYVIGFSFPVVPKGEARIRTQMSAGLNDAQLDRAIAAFIKVGRELELIK